MSARLILSILITGLLVLPASASAATKNGVTPLAPKAGKSVPGGKSPTFKVRAKGPGQVWVRVCKSRKKNFHGLICIKESIGRAKKQSGSFRYKPKFFGFPAFWLNSPGRYYWQAHRIACEGTTSDCRQEGPIVGFKVAGG